MFNDLDSIVNKKIKGFFYSKSFNSFNLILEDDSFLFVEANKEPTMFDSLLVRYNPPIPTVKSPEVDSEPKRVLSEVIERLGFLPCSPEEILGDELTEKIRNIINE